MNTRALAGLLLALPLLLSACAFDLKNQSSFEAFNDGRFRFQTFADVTWPESSEEAESARLKVLRERLGDNGLCADGFSITERKAALKYKGLLGDVYDLIYYGRCT